MSKKIIGVIGIGEVGGAITKIFAKKYNVLKKDLTYDELKITKIEVLHVCLPYTDKFEKEVLKQIPKNKPKLVIIHSTVKPGATEQIFKKSGIPTVHSPVMGTHPNLAKDILNFKKIIGPTNKISAKLAASHLKNIGINTEIFNNSLESEIAKLLDTTYYGWNIIFAKIAWDLCQKSGVDFNNVYTQLNRIYNYGYSKSRPNVIRPILKYQQGPIGGHCIMPNAVILSNYTKSPLANFLIEENSKL